MTQITDEFMYEQFPKLKEYTIVLLKPGPKTDLPDVQKLIWEHGRKNFALRADGKLDIVCPVTRESSLSGLYIFNVGEDEARTIMETDPAVEAGVFVYETHPCKSFPGDSLK